MFPFIFLAKIALDASGIVSSASVSKSVSGEEKSLSSTSKEVITPPLQPTEDDPLYNQVTALLKTNEFGTVYRIIAYELKKENNSQQLEKIIQLIEQTKEQVSAYHKSSSWFLSKQPSIILKLNTLKEQAVATRKKQKNSVTRIAAVSDHKLSSTYGATQR